MTLNMQNMALIIGVTIVTMWVANLTSQRVPAFRNLIGGNGTTITV